MPEQYFVIFENNEWKISFNDKHYGPYPDQKVAIDAAIDAAYAMGAIGIDAQVLTQDAHNSLKTEWTSEKGFEWYR